MLGLRSHYESGQRDHDVAAVPEARGMGETDEYQTYFGLGHAVQLVERPGVFRVSPAGLALGSLLVRHLDQGDLDGSFLELGTGSGVLALLLRSLGARDITATDISASAVRLAQHNEQHNFGDASIRYLVGDLFSVLDEGERFDHVIFNPPGWRSPSRHLARRISDIEGASGSDDELAVSAMFGGENVVLDFLESLPEHLTPGGRAIIGLNSMIGIRSVLSRYGRRAEGPRLRFRLLERHAFPLMLYTESWLSLQPELFAEFSRWRDQHGAAFSQDADGTIHWSYEIIECTLADESATSWP